MKGTKAIFVCRECGTTSPKWLGKCPECQSWNSFYEETVVEKPQNKNINRGRPLDTVNKAEKFSELELCPAASVYSTVKCDVFIRRIDAYF